MTQRRQWLPSHRSGEEVQRLGVPAWAWDRNRVADAAARECVLAKMAACQRVLAHIEEAVLTVAHASRRAWRPKAKRRKFTDEDVQRALAATTGMGNKMAVAALREIPGYEKVQSHQLTKWAAPSVSKRMGRPCSVRRRMSMKEVRLRWPRVMMTWHSG